MYIFELNIFGFELKASYYGAMYAFGFLIGYFFLLKRGKISKNLLEDLFFYIFFGVILGGRIGYVLFYNLEKYLQKPLDIFKFWEGGMSFHGGVIGVILAMIIFSKIKKISFYKIADEVCLVLPIGLGLGRIGNYLNKELLGFSPYNGFLAVQKNGIGYFPSPLLEAFLEGIILFLILLFFAYKKKLNFGQLSALFLIFYGIFRIFVEAFFRQPDEQIGYIFGFLTMGEILSLPMILFGIYFFWRLRRDGKSRI